MSTRLESVGLRSVYKATPATVGGVRCKPDRAMTPAYITIHNTANPNADARDHYNAQTQGHLGSMQMAVHYYVDDKDTVYQCLLDREQGWHAGDGRGPGNSTSISIEVCEKTGSDQAKAEEHAAALVADLIIQRNIPVDHVVPHKHWTGKNCPHLILPHWEKFMAQVRYYVALFEGKTPEAEPAGEARYMIRTTTETLNIRKGPGTNYPVAGQITGKGKDAYTIVAEADGPGAKRWGKLLSGAGWIALDYTRRI